MSDDLPVRKHMRRKDFNYSTNGAYFITACTQEREPFFWNETGKDEIDTEEWKNNLSEIGKIVEKQINEMQGYLGVTVDDYVVMHNHVHLLLFVNNANEPVKPDNETNTRANEIIPRFVATLKRMTNRSTGIKLWQKSYFDTVISDKRKYNEIKKYIYDNPLKYGIEDSEDY